MFQTSFSLCTHLAPLDCPRLPLLPTPGQFSKLVVSDLYNVVVGIGIKSSQNMREEEGVSSPNSTLSSSGVRERAYMSSPGVREKGEMSSA